MRRRLKRIYNYICNRVSTPAVILLYHRVTKLPIDSHLLAVSPDHFYEQISYLKRNYYLISPEEFTFLKKKNKSFPSKSVLLTFDDGYADNFLEAIPILESLDAQAVFYITTSKLNTHGKLWWDELEDILLNNTLPFKETLNLTIRGKTHSFSIKNAEDRLKAHAELHPLIKLNTVVERERILEDIRTWAGLTVSENRSHRLLTHDELLIMSRSKGCTIGAHTYDHAVLSQLNFEEQLYQIKTSKDQLERLTGKNVVHFSYPFGTKTDYDKSSVRICQALGFEMVCSNYSGVVHPWTDRFQLPRRLVRDWDGLFFKNEISDFFKG